MISIIIPNYNGENLLRKTLPKILHVLKLFKEKTEVIIVDDCSKDNSIDAIENIVKENKTGIKITLIRKEKNEGFSSSINTGVKNSKSDIVYLLNSDVIPQEGFLETLLIHFNDENIFAVGSMDESIENGKKVLRGRGIGKWERGFLNHKKGEVDKSTTLWVSGGSGAFRKSIWDKLDGFDELFNPFYWEDIDLSYRAIKSGYRVMFEAKSVVTHLHEEGSIKKNISNNAVSLTAYRNQIIFTWKNLTDSSLLFKHFLWLPYHIVKTLFQGDLLFIRALFAASIKIPQILVERKKQQRLFVLKDKDIYILS